MSEAFAETRSPARACLASGRALALLLMHRAMAQAPGLGESVELVDPKVFRVCADPHNLPFSDEQGEGFENKLAELFARKLNEPTSYTYFPQVIGFVRNTLNALRCDVIIGTAVGDPMVQTTNPYYRTTYALVFKPDSGLDGLSRWRIRGSRTSGSASSPARPRNDPYTEWTDGAGQALPPHGRYPRDIIAPDDDG